MRWQRAKPTQCGSHIKQRGRMGETLEKDARGWPLECHCSGVVSMTQTTRFEFATLAMASFRRPMHENRGNQSIPASHADKSSHRLNFGRVH